VTHTGPIDLAFINNRIKKISEKAEGMAAVPALDFEVHWKNGSEVLRAAYKKVMANHPQAKATVQNVYELITDITRLGGCIPKEIGERQEWAKIVKRAEAGRVSLCGTLEGETLLSHYTEFIC
jgi:hypothetical protein